MFGYYLNPYQLQKTSQLVRLSIDYLSGFTMPYKTDFNNEIPLCARD